MKEAAVSKSANRNALLDGLAQENHALGGRDGSLRIEHTLRAARGSETTHNEHRENAPEPQLAYRYFEQVDTPYLNCVSNAGFLPAAV
jgi:hypothetical protein